MTTVAELFVKLGIQGTDKTLGALGKTKSSIGAVASQALLAKAAITGAAFALERLFKSSSSTGADLSNFNAAFGISTQKLEQYQYAARQVNVSNDSVANSFKNIQKAITDVKLGKGAPEGLAQFSQLTGITEADFFDASFSPEKLIQAAQEYAKLEKDIGIRNAVLGSMGFDEGMIAALSKQAFQPDIMARAPVRSDQDLSALSKTQAMAANLEDKIGRAVEKLTVRYGADFMNNLSQIVDKVFQLTESLINLAEKIKIFDLLGKSIEGWKGIFDLTSKGVDFMSDLFGDNENKSEKRKDQLNNFVDDSKNVAGYVVKDLGSQAMRGLKSMVTPQPTDLSKLSMPVPKIANQVDVAAPRMPATAASQNTQNVNVQQTFNFENKGENAREVGSETKRAIQSAFRQMPALGQGS